ncbi:MexE family multidrug efflux RND transporter periplasmic adaptor subunit [Pseudomonas sp. RtIB026]|uniref:efflux RND transporter periplasmic adaptor subunit n=1 Tax=Pseudomonas sp. RtIB026 TaxID=2749999 RepID=UPI001942F20A|nr:efflux RND transporter periplasmic adaptor subunit [Pseudomonas sp. RtIB026]BCJ06784.1 MexE family multidrug efflux RND transporter periplasmic adaptor subunit [Pseudomonas sp. RtIB026]
MRAPSVSVTAIIIAALLASGCSKEPESIVASPAAVDVVNAKVRSVRYWDSFNGRVAAMESVAILPRVGGYITKVAYGEGREVSKGDLLFVIDQRPYRAALDSARAQLERARVSLAFARQQDLRAQKLISANAVSKELAEQRRTAYEQGVAEVHAAESAVATAALNLEFTEVRSPIDGRTSRARLTVGNLAVADQSVLTSVVSQDPVHVYFDPDEHSYLNYRKTLTTSAKAAVRIGLATDDGFAYEGELTFVDNEVDAATGTIRARATVRNPDRHLTPGLFAKVRFSPGEAVQVVVVPDRAILTDQDKQYVYVLSGAKTAEKRYVETGRLLGKQRVITVGLASDEQVIVSGLQQIYASGTPVLPNVLAPENDELKVSSTRHDGR